MSIIRGVSKLEAKHRPSVVSIGNYDGVHLGHQHVLQTLISQAHRLQVPSTVITFEPLAKEFFNPNGVARLTSVQQRANELMSYGVDQVLVINFTKQFAACSPEEFVSDVLIQGLGVQYLCVGDDFRFGKNRAGDFSFLQKQGQQHGFDVIAHSTYRHNNERVSSGKVREALELSDFAGAKQLLGQSYAIEGVVTEGEKIGRTINFPTANIVMEDYRLPIKGVFAVTVKLENGELQKGVANIGKRPTVDGKENRLEVHLFDFNENLYGQLIKVSFHHKIREEQKFDSIDELKSQIAVDATSARQYLKNL